MSEIADRYRRLSDAFADKIAAVPDDSWERQSPCEEWKARDVVNHVVGTADTLVYVKAGTPSAAGRFITQATGAVAPPEPPPTGGVHTTYIFGQESFGVTDLAVGKLRSAQADLSAKASTLPGKAVAGKAAETRGACVRAGRADERPDRRRRPRRRVVSPLAAS